MRLGLAAPKVFEVLNGRAGSRQANSSHVSPGLAGENLLRVFERADAPACGLRQSRRHLGRQFDRFERVGVDAVIVFVPRVQRLALGEVLARLVDFVDVLDLEPLGDCIHDLENVVILVFDGVHGDRPFCSCRQGPCAPPPSESPKAAAMPAPSRLDGSEPAGRAEERRARAPRARPEGACAKARAQASAANSTTRARKGCGSFRAGVREGAKAALQ